MRKFILIQFDSDEELANGAAAAWLNEVAKANRQNMPLYVALSGGRIARHFFAAIVAQALQRTISPVGVHFFWADERCVPPTDRESNYGIANEVLFAPLRIQPDRIHRIRGEDNPESAAAQAANEIEQVVPGNAASQPVLDFVFLGMGEDGHIASLFPGDQVRSAATYRAVTGTKPPPQRITLSYNSIAAVKEVWVLVSGKDKESALRQSLLPIGATPLAKLIEMRSKTVLYTDIRLEC